MDQNPLRVVGQLLREAQNSKKRKRPKQKMPEKEWVNLHMCTCLNELKNRSEMKDIESKYGSQQTKTLVESMKLLLKKAEENEKKKDMEMTYFYLFRFVELFIFGQKTRKSDWNFLNARFGTEVSCGMDRLQELSNQLESRYQKKMEDRGDIFTRIPPPPQADRSLDNETDDIKEKRLKKSDKETIRLGVKPTKCDAITSLELMNHFKDEKTIAIFDVRSAEWFLKSKINLNGVKVINIPNETIPSKIGKILESDAEARDVWKNRKSFDLVVIVDDVVDSNSLASSAAGKLLQSLREYDYPGKYKCLYYLEGGFRNWHHNYPAFCTKASFFDFTKTCVLSGDNSLLLDQIIYPALDEPPASVHKTIKSASSNDTMKPTTVDQPPSITKNVPTINRQIKPTIGKSVSKPAEFLKQNGHAITEEISTDKVTDKESTEEPESENGLKTIRSNNLIVDRSTKPSGLKTAQNTVDGESQIPKQIQPSLNDEWNSSSSGTTFEPLKSDSSSSTSSMKRSSSFPNISKLTDDEVCSPASSKGVEQTPPKYDRSAKPLPSTMTSSMMSSPSAQLKPHDTGIYVSNITPGLTGLKNLGNTCYMNSIVQCLSNTDQLRLQICTFNRSRDGPKPLGSVALEVDKVVRKLWAGKHKNFPCDELKNVVGKLKTSFRGCEQQDSHEFLTILLDWLHEDLNEPRPHMELSGADEASGERAWGEFLRKNNSIVQNLFYGQLKSTVTCQTCAEESVTFEPFSNLSLPLPANHNLLMADRCTLDDCLELYLTEESIAGWNCPKCKTARAATKKIDISKLPPILVIHLKRFTSNGARKKQTLVEFPVLEHLEMLKYATPGSEQRNRTYDLYAVSNHYGTMESGHYTAYCLNPTLKRWYEFNDTEVLEIQANNVRTAAAYILFYRAVNR